MPASKDRVKEVVEYSLKNGINKAVEVFDITESTLQRYKSMYTEFGFSYEPDKHDYLRMISERYDPEELKLIAKSQSDFVNKKVRKVDFEGDSVKIGFLTDTHMSSIYFKEYLWDKAIEEFHKCNIDLMCHSGDVTDGMNPKRIDQVFELTHIGFDEQKEYAVSLLSQLDFKIYMIDGNHDRWFKKSNGARIVKDIAKECNNIEYLGEDEGDIIINNITIRLWHGEDGSSYATSYRLQKLIEALTGGEKPHVLLAGHTHKQGYFFDRHIHVVSGGCIQKQSRWMRSKRLASHTGFWILEIGFNKQGVAWFDGRFYPFYQ